ncbi:MAG: hypothetical protein FWD77_08680 [Betaproteobacteria bacterium]|nr:hypothetical protein [Betaproteobacteria bacterium]
MTRSGKWRVLLCACIAFCATGAVWADEASSWTQASGISRGTDFRGERATQFSGQARNIPALEAAGAPPGGFQAEGTPPGKPRQIGYGRTLPEASARSAFSGLSWQRQSDGSVTALQRIRSEGAVALRLGLKIAPEFDGELRFAPANQTSTAIGPFTRRDWEGMSVYWSPPVEGDDMLVEIRMPDGKAPPEGAIGFFRVTHIYELPGASAASGNSFSNVYPGTYTCYNEAACAKTDAERRAVKAVAQMTFQLEDGAYVCSGSLVADANQTGTPYFFTANHCISDAATARTLVTRWNFQYEFCIGSTGEPPGSLWLYSGADYLNSEFNNDHSLLRLRDRAPMGATFLGWSTDSLKAYDTMVAIHHPNGDVKKISWGYAQEPPTGDVNVEGALHSNLWGITYTDGITQGGSSGSPLLRCDQSECKLFGGLFAGMTGIGCYGPDFNWYSKFSVAYPALKPWLGGSGPAPSGAIVQTAKTQTYLGDGLSRVQVSVRRSNDTSGTSSVQYATSAGTASPGLDFVSASGTLTWSAGETEKTVTLQLSSASRAGSDRYFDFVLSNPSGATISSTSGKTRITLLAGGAATANRIFKWAEAAYPQLFAPAGAGTQNAGNIIYRYYSGTGNYLGTQDSEVLFLGAGQGLITDAGSFDYWMPQVIGAGY